MMEKLLQKKGDDKREGADGNIMQKCKYIGTVED